MEGRFRRIKGLYNSILDNFTVDGDIALPNAKEIKAQSDANILKRSLDVDKQALTDFNRMVKEQGMTVTEAVSRMGTASNAARDYAMSCKDGSVNLADFEKQQRKSFETSQKVAKGLSGMSTATKATLANIGIGLAISAGIALVEKLASTLDETFKISEASRVEAMETAVNNYNDAVKKTGDNISSIRSLESEFETLSKGVGANGENIALSASEYERYNEIVNEIAEASPSIVKGYTAEGNAIVDRTNAIREAIAEQERYQQSAIEEYTSISAGNDIQRGAWVDASEAFKEAKKNAGELVDIFQSEDVVRSSYMDLESKGNATLDSILGIDFNAENATLAQLEGIVEKRDKIIANARKSGNYSNNQVQEMDDYITEMTGSLQDYEEALQPITDYLNAYVTKINEETGVSLLDSVPEAMRDSFQAGLREIAGSGEDAATMKSMSRNLAKSINDAMSSEDADSLGKIYKKAEEAREAFLDSDKTKDDVEAANKALNTQANALEELAEKYQETDKALSAFYQDQANSMRDFVSNTLDLETAFNPLKSAIEDARSAKETFDDAMSGGDMNTAINAHKDIYDTIMDGFNNAGNGTMAFWQGAEQLLGTDTLKEYGYDIDAINSKLKSLSSVMGDSESATGAFYQMLADNADEINSLSDDGEKLVSIAKDGAISFDFDEDQLDDVADKLNISKDLLVSMIDNARHWSDIDLSDTGDVAAAIREMDTTFEKGGKSFQFADTIAKEAQAAGLNLGEIQDRMDELQASGNIKILDIDDITDPDKIASVTETLIEMKSNLGSIDGKGFKMNADAIIQQMQQMGRSAEETGEILQAYQDRGWIESGTSDKEAGESWTDYATKQFAAEDVSNPFAEMNSSLDEMVQSINDVVLALGQIPTNLDFETNLNDIASQVNTLTMADTYSEDDVKKVQDNINAQRDYINKVKDLASQQGKTELVAECDEALNELDKYETELNKLPDKKETEVTVKTNDKKIKSALDEIENLTDEDKEVVIDAVAEYRKTGDLTNLIEIISSLPPEVQTDVIAAVFGDDDVNRVKGIIDDTNSKNVNVTATTSGQGAVNALKNAIDAISSKTVTIKAVAQKALGKASGSTAEGTPNRRKQTHYPSRARGGRLGPNGNGGPTLTGELGTELVWIPSESRSFLVGQYGPEMVDLPSDAVVYPADETRRIVGGVIPRYKFNFGSMAEGTDFGSAASGSYRPSSGSSGGRGSSSSSKRGSSSSKSSKSSSDDESPFEKELAALRHQLEMGYITQQQYYSKYQALYNKYSKDLAKNVEDQREALEDLRQAWIDAYEEAKDSLDHQLEMGAITEAQYYDKLKALGDKYYKNRKGYTKEWEAHLEELKDARKDAYDAQLDDLDRALELEKITIEQYYKEVAALQNKWLSGTEMANDREDAEEDFLDALIGELEDKMDDVSQLISDKDLFKAWEPGEDAVDDWQEFLDYLKSDEIKNMFSNIEGGTIAYGDLVMDVERELQEAMNDRYDEQKDQLDEISDLVEETLRWEAKERIKSLEEAIDKYNDIIDAKKKSLQITEDELSYQDEMNDLATQISKKQAEIAVLSRDDSRAGQAKLAQAQEELAELLKEQNQTVRDETIDRTEDALDEQSEKFEEILDAEIQKIEDWLDNISAVLEEVAKTIENRETNDLLERIILYNSIAGDGLEDTVKDAFEDLENLIKKYGNDWEKITAILQKGTDDDKTGGILPAHHGGLATGFTGDGANLKQHEVYRLLTDDELVLNRTDQMRLMGQLNTIEAVNKTFDSVGRGKSTSINSSPTSIELSVNAPINIEGSVSKDTMKELNKVGDQIADSALNKLSEALRINGVGPRTASNARKI